MMISDALGRPTMSEVEQAKLISVLIYSCGAAQQANETRRFRGKNRAPKSGHCRRMAGLYNFELFFLAF